MGTAQKQRPSAPAKAPASGSTGPKATGTSNAARQEKLFGGGKGAAQGKSGGGGSFPFQDTIARLFGEHDVGAIQARTGPDAEADCVDAGASAMAEGHTVTFSGTPDLGTAAHEAA